MKQTLLAITVLALFVLTQQTKGIITNNANIVQTPVSLGNNEVTHQTMLRNPDVLHIVQKPIIAPAQPLFSTVVPNKCTITGKYNHICTSNPNSQPTTNIYKPFYKCYKNAICTNVNNECKWLQTPEFKECLNEVKTEFTRLMKPQKRRNRTQKRRNKTQRRRNKNHRPHHSFH